MTLVMLEPDLLGRQAEIVAALHTIVPGEGVIADAPRLRTHEAVGPAMAIAMEALPSREEDFAVAIADARRERARLASLSGRRPS
jgi:hypothetical protein